MSKSKNESKYNFPAISVIIPMYKVEPYIKICVDSVLNQTFQDFEIIIVDDASPDNCYEICQQLYRNNENIKIVRHKQNQGLGFARNTGVKYARGKYIYFLDSDDLILPNTLAKLYEAAEKSNADVVHMTKWYETIPDNVDERRELRVNVKTEPDWKEGYLNTDLLQRLSIHWKDYNTWSMTWLNFYRSDFLKKHNMKFANMISEDETFAFATYCFAERFFKIPFPAYIYRKRKNSIMSSDSIDKLSDVVTSLIIGIRYIKKIMKKVPIFSANTSLKWFCIEILFNRFYGNFIFQHYRNGSININLDEAVKKSLNETYGENTEFVKYLFHNYYDIRQKLIQVTNENQYLRKLIDDSVQK